MPVESTFAKSTLSLYDLYAIMRSIILLCSSCVLFLRSQSVEWVGWETKAGSKRQACPLERVRGKMCLRQTFDRATDAIPSEVFRDQARDQAKTGLRLGHQMWSAEVLLHSSSSCLGTQR